MEKSGEATASKMKNQIEKNMKQSLDENTKDIDLLLDFAGVLEYLVLSWRDPNLHFKNLIETKYSSIEDVPKDLKRCLQLALRHDSSLFIFFDLWRELGQAIRELICCNYDTVPRSLRWMIEACIFWVDMQLDEDTAEEVFKYYCTEKDKINDEEYLRLFNDIYLISETRLAERLTFKEKYRRLAVKEIIENLSILKTKKDSPVKGHRIRKGLNKAYSYFSEYSHITMGTLREAFAEAGELRTDFAFFQNYNYNKEDFDLQLHNIFMTLDLILSVIFLVEAHFYSYDNPRQFFENLEELNMDFGNKIKPLSKRFVLLYKMLFE